MKKVDEILKRRPLPVARGNRQRDEQILRGMEEGEQGERSNVLEKDKSMEGE